MAALVAPGAGIEALEGIKNRQSLDSYHLFYAVLADFEAKLNQFQAAARNLRKAIGLTDLKSEQKLLKKRLHDCESLSRG